MRGFPIWLPLATLSFIGAPAFANAQGECHVARHDEILGLFEQWNARLQSGDPGQVAALYLDGALLLPTLSASPRLTRQAHMDYFRGFLAARPVGTLDETHVFAGCGEATLAGLYTFRFASTGKAVPARFTFNYRRIDGEWLITHHHSSVLPTQ